MNRGFHIAGGVTIPPGNFRRIIAESRPQTSVFEGHFSFAVFPMFCLISGWDAINYKRCFYDYPRLVFGPAVLLRRGTADRSVAVMFLGVPTGCHGSTVG